MALVRLVRLTSEALLAQMLAKADVHELFGGCVGCRSSNQASGSVSRFNTQVLTADLRWRNPDWYAELHRRARIYYTTRLQTHAQESIVYYSITFPPSR